MPVPILVSDPAPEILPPSVSALACVSTVRPPSIDTALPSESPLAAACRVVPSAAVRPALPSAVLVLTASVPPARNVPPE